MWPHSQEFWESMNKWLFICFYLLCLDWSKWPQGWQAEEKNKVKKKKKKRWNYEIQEREKNVLTSLLAPDYSLYLGTEIHNLERIKRESLEKSTLLWSERWPHERKWSPAVVLHERNPTAHSTTTLLDFYNFGCLLWLACNWYNFSASEFL